MTYAMPDNITNMTDFTLYINTITSNQFWGLMVLAMGVIAFLYLLGRDVNPKACFSVSSFMMGVSGAFLWGMGLIPEAWLLFFFIAFAAGFIALWFD